MVTEMNDSGEEVTRALTGAERVKRSREKRRTEKQLVTRQVALTQEQWDKVDAMHGEMDNPPEYLWQFYQQCMKQGSAFAVNSGGGPKVKNLGNGNYGREES